MPRLSYLLALAACGVHLEVPAAAQVRCARSDQCPGDRICGAAGICVEADAQLVPGVVVTPRELVTDESGGSSSFVVSLATRPRARVTILIGAVSSSEVEVAARSLSIEPDSWNVPQRVSVTGLPDCLADGDQVVDIDLEPVISADPAYDGIDPGALTVTNRDTRAAGVTVTPSSGLLTGERGGTANFSLRLTCPPIADVTLALRSDDPTEGAVQPAVIEIEAHDWETPHIATVTGVPDCAADGDVAYTIVIDPAASADPAYDGFDVDDVALINRDELQASVVLTNADALETTENGGLATFGIALGCRPEAPVTVPLASSEATEGRVTPDSVVFGPDDWQTPRTVVVSGQPDCTSDGDTAYTVVLLPLLSDDPPWSGLDAPDVPVLNRDVPGGSIVIGAGAALETAEDGRAVSVAVRLSCSPNSAVAVTFASDNTDEGRLTQTAGACDPSGAALDTACTVTLDAANWETGATVRIAGWDDFFDDGDVAYDVTSLAASADPEFDGKAGAPIRVTNVDDDSAGIALSPSALAPSERTAAAFTVTLTSQPTAPVAVALETSDSAQGVVTPASVVLDAGNWLSGVTATLTPVNNSNYGANPAYAVTGSSDVGGADAAYRGRTSNPIAVLNGDDERRIFVRDAPVSGTFGGVAAADGLCANSASQSGLPGEWKALLGGGGRRACQNPSCSSNSPTEQQDWVLHPSTGYFRVGSNRVLGPRIGTTTTNRIFPFPLENSIAASSVSYWTGMLGNWTGDLFPCTDLFNGGQPWQSPGGGTFAGSGASTNFQAIGPLPGSDSDRLACSRDTDIFLACVEQ